MARPVAIKKKPPFFNKLALITREIMRSSHAVLMYIDLLENVCNLRIALR